MSQIKKCEICGHKLTFIHEEVGYLHVDWEMEKICGHNLMPTEEEATKIERMAEFGYFFEEYINPRTLWEGTCVRNGLKSYTIVQAMERYEMYYGEE